MLCYQGIIYISHDKHLSHCLMNNFFIKVKSSTFYTICSLKKHRRNISLIKVKYWKNVLLLIKYYWCIASVDSPAPGSSQTSREIHFLRPQSDGRADIHLLVVIFVMNELWVAETQGRGGIFPPWIFAFFYHLVNLTLLASCPEARPAGGAGRW